MEQQPLVVFDVLNGFVDSTLHCTTSCFPNECSGRDMETPSSSASSRPMVAASIDSRASAVPAGLPNSPGSPSSRAYVARRRATATSLTRSSRCPLKLARGDGNQGHPTRARELSIGRPGRGDPPETCAPGRASHASLASTPRASSGRVDFGLGRWRWSGPCSSPRAADSGAGRAWRGTDTESSGGSVRHSGGPPSNRPEDCRVSTNRVAVHGLHWPFFALPPLRAPPSIRPATTACPPSPTCTCWCCTTTRCMPLVFSFCSVRHPD